MFKEEKAGLRAGFFKDLVLTFEILEIYKGDKYTEVAVSEINFDLRSERSRNNVLNNLRVGCKIN